HASPPPSYSLFPRCQPLTLPPLFPYTTLFRSLESSKRFQCFRCRFDIYTDLIRYCKCSSRIQYIVMSKNRQSHANRLIFMYKIRSEEHTSELQSRFDLVCRLLLDTKKLKIHCL